MRWRDIFSRRSPSSEGPPEPEVLEEGTPEPQGPAVVVEIIPAEKDWVAESIREPMERIQTVKGRVALLRQEFGIVGAGYAPNDQQALADWSSLYYRAVRRIGGVLESHRHRQREVMWRLSPLLFHIEFSDYETRLDALDEEARIPGRTRLPRQPKLSVLEYTENGIRYSSFESDLFRAEMSLVLLFAAYPENKEASLTYLHEVLDAVRERLFQPRVPLDETFQEFERQFQ